MTILPSEISPDTPPSSDSGQNDSANKKLFLLAVSFALALTILQINFGNEQTRFDELAGGATSKVHMEPYEGKVIHAMNPGLPGMIQGFNSRNEHPVVLMGASQLHTLNPYQPGDRPVSWYLHHNLAKHGVPLMTFSSPNLGNQELLVAASMILTHMKPKALVYALVLDDMRNDGIRSGMRGFLHQPEIQSLLKTTRIGQTLLTRNPIDRDSPQANAGINQKSSPSPNSYQDSSSESDSPWLPVLVRDQSEAALNNWLESNTGLWKLRGQARGHVFLFLHKIRHLLSQALPDEIVLGGNLSEAMPESAFPEGKYRTFNDLIYEENLAALRATTGMARERHIPVLLYLQPRPPESTYPYSPEIRARFKNDLASLSRESGVTVQDLEMVVPQSGFGFLIYQNVLFQDIFHLNDTGHRQLADFLSLQIRDWMKAPS